MSAGGARVLIVGAGDVGLKIARGLAETTALRHLILADLNCDHLVEAASFLSDCTGIGITIEQVDGRDQAQVEALLKRAHADLIVQTAALIGPWATLGKKDPVAEALAKAGLGVQLPAQLPVLLTVMSAVRALGLETPVANLSLPDIAHPILQTQGLAPTIGLGNASICHLRVRAALRAELDAQGREDEELPLIRLLAHHHHVYGVMQGQAPSKAADGVQVFIGEAGERRDELAYRGRSIPPGPIYNVITAASVISVLQALLPGAAPLRFSAPAPLGMAGGYPLSIAPEAVVLDLPAGVDLAEAQALHERMGAADGIAGIEGDGTVRFTAAASAALAKLEPCLTEPLALADLDARALLLQDVVARIKA